MLIHQNISQSELDSVVGQYPTELYRVGASSDDDGKFTVIAVLKEDFCPKCNGSGTIDVPHGSIDCPNCYGTGFKNASK